MDTPSKEAMQFAMCVRGLPYGTSERILANALDTFAAAAVKRAVEAERIECVRECMSIARSHEVEDRDTEGRVVNVYATESSETASDCAKAIRARAAHEEK